MCTSDWAWHQCVKLAHILLREDCIDAGQASLVSDFILVNEDRERKLSSFPAEPKNLHRTYARYLVPVLEALSDGYDEAKFANSAKHELNHFLESYTNYTNPYLMAVVGTLSPSVIFDIGCGAGHNILSFAKDNKNVFCFGIDAECVRVERALIIATALKLNRRCFFQQGEFVQGIEIGLPRAPDVVLFSSVLNDFIQDSSGALRLIRAAHDLYPNAKIVLGDFIGADWRNGVFDSNYDLTYIHDFNGILSGSCGCTFERQQWKKIRTETGLEEQFYGEWGGSGFQHFVSVLQ
jgi:SAM-dependent methyltransferase